MKQIEILTPERLESTNFLSDIVTAVLMSLAAGAMIVTDFDYDATFTAILDNNWDYVVGIAVPSFITFATKIIKNIKAKEFSFKAILKSKNAITKLLVVLSGVFAALNLAIDPEMPTVLGEALFSGSLASIITAVLATIINPIWHIIFDKSDDDNISIA